MFRSWYCSDVRLILETFTAFVRMARWWHMLIRSPLRPTNGLVSHVIGNHRGRRSRCHRSVLCKHSPRCSCVYQAVDQYQHLKTFSAVSTCLEATAPAYARGYKASGTATGVPVNLAVVSRYFVHIPLFLIKDSGPLLHRQRAAHCSDRLTPHMRRLPFKGPR